MSIILIVCKQVDEIIITLELIIFPYSACLENDKVLGWGQNSGNQDV